MAESPPTRQLLSAEEGAVYKVTAAVRIALAYPNTYRVAMSNLGWQLVYNLLNRRDDTLCERVCLPVTPVRNRLGSLESDIALERFDIVAFSVSFESDYLNLLKILSLGGIEPEKVKREEGSPLVIMGGICAFMNPEPLADFVDVFVLGEAEGALDDFVETYKQAKDAGENKEGVLCRLAQLPGVYVPRFYEVNYNPDGTVAAIISAENVPAQLEVQVTGSLSACEGSSQLFSPYTEFKDTCLIELSRGCARGCNFCLLGSLYRPYRARSLESVKAMVDKARRLGKKVGLLAAAASDYPYLDELCDYLAADSLNLGISSLRIESLSDALLRILFESGQKSFTLAPEAGSEKLRRFINKKFTDDDILQTIERAAQVGFYNVKLYFMLGLPTEKQADLRAIVDLSKAVKDRLLKYARPRGKMGRVVLSLSGFVPKPHTPFQWMPMERENTLKRKFKFVNKALSREGNIKVVGESPRQVFTQGLLARGDRRMGRLLLKVNELGNWKQAIKACGIDKEFYMYRKRDINEILPWQHLQDDKVKTRLRDIACSGNFD